MFVVSSLSLLHALLQYFTGGLICVGMSRQLGMTVTYCKAHALRSVTYDSTSSSSMRETAI